MKRLVVSCDVCGRDIADREIKYKGKRKLFYINEWRKIDICSDCFLAFEDIRMRKERSETE